MWLFSQNLRVNITDSLRNNNANVYVHWCVLSVKRWPELKQPLFDVVPVPFFVQYKYQSTATSSLFFSLYLIVSLQPLTSLWHVQTFSNYFLVLPTTVYRSLIALTAVFRAFWYIDTLVTYFNSLFCKHMEIRAVWRVYSGTCIAGCTVGFLRSFKKYDESHITGVVA